MKPQKRKYLVAVPGISVRVSKAYSPDQAVSQRIAILDRRREQIKSRVSKLRDEKGCLEKFALELPDSALTRDKIIDLEINVCYLLAERDNNELTKRNRFDYLKKAREILINNGYGYFHNSR